MAVKPFVVSLCGAAGAGKSTLAVALAEAVGERASRVPADYYLLATEDRTAPLRWDWTRLAADLARPPSTTVTTPAIDFTSLCRGVAGDRRSFVIRPLMLIDAMQPFPSADLVIRLVAPREVRRARLAERDQCWGTVVLAHWDRLESTAATAKIDPAGHVLAADRPVTELVAAARQLIAACCYTSGR